MSGRKPCSSANRAGRGFSARTTGRRLHRAGPPLAWAQMPAAKSVAGQHRQSEWAVAEEQPEARRIAVPVPGRAVAGRGASEWPAAMALEPQGAAARAARWV